MKFTTARPPEDGSLPSCDVAISVFGYQNHISIDRGFGLIRKWSATDAAAYEGSRLREGLLDKSNKAAGVWADTAYHSTANEAFKEKNGLRSHCIARSPRGEPCRRRSRGPITSNRICSRVEHVFAEQKDRMELFIRTIGIARARVKIRLANLVYNTKRLLFVRRMAAA